MSRLTALHLNDLDQATTPHDEPDRTRRLAALLTVAIVLAAGGVLLLVPSGEAPRAGAGDPAPAVAGPSATTPSVVATETGPAADATPTTPSVILPAGTALPLEIAEPLAEIAVGTAIVATLVGSLEVDGAVAVDGGAKVFGRVTETIELGEGRGSGVFGLEFDRIEVDGRSTTIVAALRDRELDLAPGRRLELVLAEPARVPLEPEPPAN